MKLFLDTNYLLEHYKTINEPFVISSMTLWELETIKSSNRHDEQVRYKARKAIHFLDGHSDMYEVMVVNREILCILDDYGLNNTPDNQICASAYYYSKRFGEIVFCTEDLCCRTIASKVFKLGIMSGQTFDEDIYLGYEEIKGNTAQINQYMERCSSLQWYANEYLIIENTDDGSVKELRYDGEKFVPLRLPPSKYIKGKNALQRCALDALANPDITIVAILGTYGSGKTWLNMQMALYNIKEKGRQSRILGVREVVGQGKEIGYLPGDVDDKTENFFLPLVQSLNGGEFELASLKQQGIIETNIPFFMKGTTYHNTIILCDEAEDLTESQIRLIGTRLGENSRVFFSGDYKQSVINASHDNALVRMCQELKGKSNFACISLNEDVRSESSKCFAELFK